MALLEETVDCRYDLQEIKLSLLNCIAVLYADDLEQKQMMEERLNLSLQTEDYQGLKRDVMFILQACCKAKIENIKQQEKLALNQQKAKWNQAVTAYYDQSSDTASLTEEMNVETLTVLNLAKSRFVLEQLEDKLNFLVKKLDELLPTLGISLVDESSPLLATDRKRSVTNSLFNETRSVTDSSPIQIRSYCLGCFLL